MIRKRPIDPESGPLEFGSRLDSTQKNGANDRQTLSSGANQAFSAHHSVLMVGSDGKKSANAKTNH